MKNGKRQRAKNIPDILPANVSDWINYAARYGSSNCQIHVVLEFQGRLDVARLAQAIRLSVDIEPILGCRFIEDEHRPYWQRLVNLDDIEWCSLEETRDKETALRKFLRKTSDMEHDPQVMVKLIRSGENDTMCVKLSHDCCDGGGVKEYLELLAGIYTSLGDDKGFEAKPNVLGKRDLSRLFMELGIVDLRTAWDPQLAEKRPTWAFPSQPGQPVEPQFSVRRLFSRHVHELSTYAKKRGATVNDVILTAFFRALFEMVKPESGDPMEILVTVDLRRYLPDGKADAICNLSGITNVRITRIPAESFEATLSRIEPVMKDIKRNHPGVHSAVAFEFLSGLTFRQALKILQGIRQQTIDSGKCSPTLSNLGVLSRSPLQFGEIVVGDLYLIPPPVHAPGFVLVAGTYNQVLTLTSSYYEPTTRREDVEQLLSLVSTDLIYHDWEVQRYSSRGYRGVN